MKIFKFFLTIFTCAFLSVSAFAATSVTFWHMEGVPHRVDRIQTLIDEMTIKEKELLLQTNFKILWSKLWGHFGVILWSCAMLGCKRAFESKKVDFSERTPGRTLPWGA